MYVRMYGMYVCAYVRISVYKYVCAHGYVYIGR